MSARIALECFGQDLRQAARGLLRNRTLMLTALAAIAVGTGATSSVFSVVDRILFRSLPYLDSERLVSVGVVAPLISTQDWLFSATYQEWRSARTPFAAFTSWAGISDCDVGEEQPARLGCAQVESTFLPTLGITPILGRNFTAEEDRPGTNPVVLVSYGFWQSRLGGDRNAIGRSLTLDGGAATVIGVLPAEFELPSLDSADVVRPAALKTGAERMRLVKAIARLKPGVTPEAAADALQPLFTRFVESAPLDIQKVAKMRLRVRTLRDQQTQDSRLASWILLAAVLAVLLIACANVANLLLARAATRRRELAVRAALGAARGRLIRQSLIESLLLGGAGGALGCALGYALLRGFIAIAPQGITRLGQATLDLRVLGFTCAVSLLSGVLFGIAPSIETPKLEALTGWRAVGGSRNRLRRILVTAQIAASLVLLSGAGLLLASLHNLQNTPLGMTTERVLTASFTLPRLLYADSSRLIAFYRELEARLKRLPGVAAAAVADSLPPGGDPRSVPFVAMKNPGGDSAAQGMAGNVYWRYVTPDYFAALGIPIVSGRGFHEEDRAAGPPVIVLNQALAARLFPNDNPVGRRIGPNLVIGVARDVKNSGLAGPVDPEFYCVRKHEPDQVFQNQRPPYGWRRGVVLVRTVLDERAAAEMIRTEIRGLDSSLPVTIETMHRQVGHLLQQPRFNAALLALFAGIAVLLAAIGLYGLISFLVTERTQEIGVRMALGATPGAVMKLVLGQALRWTAAGVALGLLGSFWVSQYLATLLYQVPPRDPWTMAAAVALLCAVAGAAAWTPCRRASRVDPMLALRQE